MNTTERIKQIEQRLGWLDSTSELENVKTERVAGSCKKHGDYISVERQIATTFFSVPKIALGCPACARDELAELRNEEELEHREKNKHLISALMKKLALKKRNENCGFKNYIADTEILKHNLEICKNYALSWSKNLSDGNCLLMSGSVGTGKTHLACAIARTVVNKFLSSVIMTTQDALSMHYKSSYDAESKITEEQIIKHYTSADLLIIDEVGACLLTETNNLIMTRIICERYDEQKPIILISNNTLDELYSSVLGARVMSRITKANDFILTFAGDDFRARAKQ